MWLDRLNVWLLCALLVLSPLAANASQNALFSPTTGTVSGLQLSNNYNNAIDSVNTCNAGSTSPVNQISGVPSRGNCWFNTSASPFALGWYDGVSFLTPFWLDGVNHYPDVKIGGGVATVGAASTIDLCASANAPQAVISILGTATINSFGSTCNPGHIKILSFSGSLTLTNSSSLILPGGTNIITAAGDQAAIYPVSNGVWQILVYTPANGQAIVNDLTSGLCSAQMTWSPAIPGSNKYLYAYGQSVSRSTYAAALAACTITQSASSTIGSPTLTGFSDTTQLAPGMAIEGAMVPPGTVIAPAGCTSTTCTMSNNATSTTTSSVQIFPYGNGCGFGTSCVSASTSFNLPDCRDIVMAGRGNMGGSVRSDSYAITKAFYGAGPNALGVFGGAQSYMIQQQNLPNVAPSFIGSAQTWGASSGSLLQYTGTYIGGVAGAAGNGLAFTNGTPTAVNITTTVTPAGTVTSINGGVAQTSMPTIQPTQMLNCMVRVLARLESDPRGRRVGANDYRSVAAIADRRRLAA